MSANKQCKHTGGTRLPAIPVCVQKYTGTRFVSDINSKMVRGAFFRYHRRL